MITSNRLQYSVFSRFLQVIANLRTEKNILLIKDATLDIEKITLEDAANQLPQLKSRYERLQTIFNDLWQGLGVFNLSITAFLQILQQKLIFSIKVAIVLMAIMVPYILYASIDSCKVLEVTGVFRFMERPCTYWEALQRVLKVPYNISGSLFMSGLTYQFIIATTTALVILTLIPGQMAQYRNQATTVLHSVKLAFQED